VIDQYFEMLREGSPLRAFDAVLGIVSIVVASGSERA